jgi:hypothetical protein
LHAAHFSDASFYFPLMAQKNSFYEMAWKKVDEHIKKGLPKSAMEEVDRIYAQAKKEKIDVQQVKALVYKGRLVGQVEEDNWYKNVQAFEKR